MHTVLEYLARKCEAAYRNLEYCKGMEIDRVSVYYAFHKFINKKILTSSYLDIIYNHHDNYKDDWDYKDDQVDQDDGNYDYEFSVGNKKLVVSRLMVTFTLQSEGSFTVYFNEDGEEIKFVQTQ